MERLSAVRWRNYNTVLLCHIDFTQADQRVRDHNYLTGKIRGAAHSKCNTHNVINAIVMFGFFEK